MTRHIQVITCIIIKENLRSCFFMKRKKNNSTFWLACVKPRYKDFNINRCWPTCQSAWCIDCCPLQLKKRWNFEIQTVLYSSSSINWLLRGQKLVSLLVEILTDADDAWAENALEEFSLTLLPFFRNAKSWLLSTKKLRYRKDFPLRNATSNSILVIRWKNIVIKCGAMFFSAKSNWSLNASERQYQTNNIMTASLQKVVRSLQRASVKLWSLQQLKWYF